MQDGTRLPCCSVEAQRRVEYAPLCFTTHRSCLSRWESCENHNRRWLPRLESKESSSPYDGVTLRPFLFPSLPTSSVFSIRSPVNWPFILQHLKRGLIGASITPTPISTSGRRRRSQKRIEHLSAPRASRIGTYAKHVRVGRLFGESR